MIGNVPHLFCFGFGFTAAILARRLVGEGWIVSGTSRSEAKRQQLRREGVRLYAFDRDRPLAEPDMALAGVTDVLSAVPPDEVGDPVLDQHQDLLLTLPRLRWVGYLSTTGVYGDAGGAIVDETAPLRPTSARSRRRVEAERRWLDLNARADLPVHSFRLAGIYGRGRSALDQVRAGVAKRVAKPGHLFGRIHVEDIATVLRASMARPDPGRVYNVCDDLPAEPADVVLYACQLLGREPPALVAFEAIKDRLSPMARSFWRDNRRVDNSRIKREFGIELAYPDYRRGLAAIAREEGSAPALLATAEAVLADGT